MQSSKSQNNQRSYLVLGADSLWCSGKDDVVDGNKDKFDKVPNDAHYCEAHDAGLKNFHVFVVIWFLAFLIEVDRVFDKSVDLSSDVIVLFLLISAVDHLLLKLS